MKNIVKIIDQILTTAVEVSMAVLGISTLVPDYELALPDGVAYAFALIGGIARVGKLLLPKLKEVWGL